LVLLKVADKKMVISPANIAKAIHWAIDHREKYRIRIINISVTADEPRSYKESPVAQAAEAAIRAGIMVVAAVGNNPERPILPPANSPNVLSVGGLNDQNTPGKIDDALYHSSYGKTVDDFLKPELIAPAIWIAAPILPNTAQHLEAQALFRILSAKGRSFSRIIEQEIRHLKFDSDILEKKSVEKIKEKVKERIAQAKYISPHYKHADATSFAAPIVASVIAQMLEVNPKLTPAIIREILFTTARPLPNIAAERQGYGVINAKAALQKALSETHYFPRKRQSSPLIDYKKQLITFYYHNHSARTVALAGNFNGWSRFGLSFKKEAHGRWKIEIPLMAKGTYQYKFVVNGEIWVDDPRNPHRELDGANGFNSKLVIE
jgi:serine protease AprX